MMDAWVDRELAPDQRRRFDHHLVNCRDCSAQAQALQRLTTLLENRSPCLPSAGLKKKTLALFIEESGPRGMIDWWTSFGWRMQAGMMASILVGLGIGCTLGAGWTEAHQLSQSNVSGFLFSAGGLLSPWT
jgi:anti-sigma factor RsiW